MILIPEKEIEIKFIRSSGPGGQNVNRRATKAQLRWNLEKSQVFTEEQKELIRRKVLHLITKSGDIIIESDETRYQDKNKGIAILRLNGLINRALKKEKKRISTKPSRAAKERRLEEKKRKSEKKKMRQEGFLYYLI